MMKSKDKTHLQLRDSFFPELDSELNRFKQIYYGEISKNEDLLKKNYSFLSSEDNNDNNNHIYSLNDYDIISNNNSMENFQKKSSLFQSDKNNNNPLNIYKEIKLYIEKFINNYKNEKILLSFILKEIFNAIIIIIKDFIKTNNSSFSENKQNPFITTSDECNTIRNSQSRYGDLDLNINSKIVFLLTIQKLNDKIKKLEEEIEFFKNILNIPRKKIFGQEFINLFKKKYSEQKAKNKKEEYKYLFCIEEQEKKIKSLEKELKKKQNENLPIEKARLLRCFPNFHQYNFKEDINPKSIPMFQQFKIEKTMEKDNSKTARNLSQYMKQKKALFNNDSCSYDRKKLFLTNSDLFPKNNSIINKKDKSKNKKKCNNCNIELNNNYEININPIDKKHIRIKKHFYRTNNNSINVRNNNKGSDYINGLLQDYHPKTILDHNKEFFISHPTLDIAGVIKKKELKYVGLPQKLIKLKVHKHLEKNMLITFPSSLNETLLNLEKLRKCRNIKNEYKY